MSNLLLPNDYIIYTKPTQLEISQTKLATYKKLTEIKQWGIRNPTKFLAEFLGVELLDSQEYVFMNSWTKPFVLWLESRAAGKTTMLALFSMTKGLLFNNYRIYICSGTADQSQETFKKIEDIAFKRISSMPDITDIFKNEVEVNQANSNGFIHNPMGFTYTLYNGSFVKTLNSNINAKRGKRCDCVVFDEGGWLSEEDFNVIGAFTAMDSGFQLGKQINVSAIPKSFPNQLLYASSASSVDTSFYKKYRDFSKLMLLGDPRYFVADINCDIVINATYKGKLYNKPLLNRETIENELRNNPEKAQREYYNRFSQDGGKGQIIKRALIVRNSHNRPPVLFNDTNMRKFVFAYDPARSSDNSILAIGELREDSVKGLVLDVVNCVSFSDLSLRKRTPMRTPEQIKAIKDLILDYNGLGDDYDNIECILVDAGSGGAGVNICDFFLSNWKDKKGNEHRGLIDKIAHEEYIKTFPDAIDKIKMLQPTEYKAEMFEALIKMIESDYISFPEKYDNKGYINILETDEVLMAKSKDEIMEKLDKMDLDVITYEEKLEEELSKIEAAKTNVYKLTLEEEIALTQIDAMKEEIVNICRIKRDGKKDSFKLPPHKDSDTGNSEATMHDDRAYCLAMLGWFLSEMRRKRITLVKQKKTNIKDYCKIRHGKKISQY